MNRLRILYQLPLRLSEGRVALYGWTLVFIGQLPFLLFPNMNGKRWNWPVLWDGNWSYFVAAGATVGTRDLMDPHRFITWQLAHGFIRALPWAYPPAVAWFFAAFAHVPLAVGFWLNAAVMLGACALCGLVASQIYGLAIAPSIFAVFAWEPAVAAISDGENASFAMLLGMVCVLGIARGRYIVAGTAAGLLLFKPTDAAVFVLLLALRREWRALAVAGVIGLGWYVAGVPAAAGDWNWPYHYIASMGAYYSHQDFSNAMISVSALGIRLGLPAFLANAACAVLLLAWCVISVRVSALEAASFAGLIGIAVSPHANPYEAALLAPAIFYIMTSMSEPWRTRVVAVAYATGGISIFRWFIDFDPVAILVFLGTVAYVGIRLTTLFAPRHQLEENIHA